MRPPVCDEWYAAQRAKLHLLPGNKRHPGAPAIRPAASGTRKPAGFRVRFVSHKPRNTPKNRTRSGRQRGAPGPLAGYPPSPLITCTGQLVPLRAAPRSLVPFPGSAYSQQENIIGRTVVCSYGDHGERYFPFINLCQHSRSLPSPTVSVFRRLPLGFLSMAVDGHIRQPLSDAHSASD